MKLNVPLLFLILCMPHESRQNPHALPNKREFHWTIATRLHALNTLMYKDVATKLFHAQNLQTKYRGTLSYELGTITASILNTFRDMLNKYGSSRCDILRTGYYVSYAQECYAYIHGGYMQILHDKELFESVLYDYNAKKRQRQQNHIDAYNLLHPTTTPHNPNKYARRDNGATPPSDKEYKRMLRLRKWGEKWNYFDPVVEGIDINVKFDKELVKKAMKMKLKKK